MATRAPVFYQPSKVLLREYLNEPLYYYELWMMSETANALVAGGLGTVQTNAYLEVFVIHARNLYDFFAKERPLESKNPDKQDDSIVARHYVPDWEVDKAKDNPVLKKYFGKGKPANTEAFHLSAKRLLVPKTKWPFAEIACELALLWEEFAPKARALGFALQHRR